MNNETENKSWFKGIFSFLITSGILINILYIYGYYYYEGFIVNLGFDYIFFPLNPEELFLWIYDAARNLTISLFGLYFSMLLVVLAVTYISVRFGNSVLKKILPKKKDFLWFILEYLIFIEIFLYLSFLG